MLNANDDRGKKVPSRMVYIYVMFIVFIRGANNFLHMFFFHCEFVFVSGTLFLLFMWKIIALSVKWSK